MASKKDTPVTMQQLQGFNPDFSALKSQMDKFNTFRSIRIQKLETRHSNVLASLLDSKETHKLGNTFAKAFFSAVLAKEGKAIAEKLQLSGEREARDFFQKEGFRFLVEREHPFIDDRGKRRFIDLLMVTEDPSYPVLICIENKVMTFQHDSQLEAYERHVLGMKKYENYKKLFLYLTPTKEIIADDLWIKISYAPVLQALDETLAQDPQLDFDVKVFLTHYRSIIRRDIMNDDQEFRKECMRLYMQDKAIYQAIFRNTIGAAQGLLANVIDEKLCDLEKAGKIEKLKSSNTEFRFVTKSLLDVIPYETTQSEKRTWKSKSRVVYWIVVSSDSEEKLPIPAKITFFATLVTADVAEDREYTARIEKVCNGHLARFGIKAVARSKADQKHMKDNPTRIYKVKNAVAVPDELGDEFRIELHGRIDEFIDALQKNLESELKAEFDGNAVSATPAQP